MKTAVAFMIFNRPDTASRVFEEIRRARPPKLLVVADGPRAGREGKDELVAATRKIIDQVNWPCEVLRNYSNVNPGCKKKVPSGIDWVFSLVEEAIILEDDCLPDIRYRIVNRLRRHKNRIYGKPLGPNLHNTFTWLEERFCR